MQTPDVAIVGGSISGAVTAIALAASGLSTLIVEQSSFPRRKSCGEGLSPRGVALLEQLNAGSTLESAPAFAGYSVWVGGREHVFNAGEKRGRGSFRTELDASLLRQASLSARVEVSKVRSIASRGDRFRLLTDGEEIAARFLVLACGISSPFPRQLGFHSVEQHGGRSGARFGASMLMKTANSLDRVHIVKQTGFELFCTQVAENAFNFSVLGHGEFVRIARTDEGIAKLLAILSNETGISGLPAERALFSGPFGRKRSPASRGAAYLVGDAAEVLDPVGGMGMTHAISSGVLAARAICRAAWGGSPLEEAAREYDRGRELAVRPLRLFTDLIHSAVSAKHSSRILMFAERSGLARLAVEISHTDPASLQSKLVLPPLCAIRALMSVL